MSLRKTVLFKVSADSTLILDGILTMDNGTLAIAVNENSSQISVADLKYCSQL